MIDYGMRQTDLAVRRAEWRLSRVYRQAQRDIDEKLKDWQKRHEEREKRYRQQLADGKITQADFDAWMRGQVFQDKQWQARKAEIDRILLNADREAQRIVNEGKIGVFADNANYIGYDLERNGNVNTGFTLYDQNTVGRLIKSDPQILPKPAPGVQKDKAYTYYNKLMNSAITQGIVQGETIPQIAKRIIDKTGESSYKSAVRNARTAYTGAQNAGRMEGLHQAQALGIKVKKQWMATLDDRTRDTHADLDGQIRDVDEPFEVDGMEIDYPGDPTADKSLVYNCFVGDTNIATDSDIIRSYRHDYSGDLVEVETAGGVHFTCTPNHPILTSVGWVPAALLNNRYNLLVANVRNEFGLHRNGNIKHIHTRMKALFNALHYVGLMDRDATLRVDFHGDIPTTDVEVITKKWKLRGNRDSGCADGVDKLLFKDSNEPLVSKSAFVQHFGSVGFAAFRFIGSFGKALAFFWRRLSHAVIHGFRAIAGSDTSVFQAQAYNVAGDMQLIRECLDGFTGKVFVDNIVNIKITTVSHVPVYNLQTGTGHYFVSYIIPQKNAKCNDNYVIAKNCRCTLTYVYPDYPSEMQRRDNETGEIVGDMTYREWEEMKQGEGEAPEEPNAPVAKDIEYGDLFPDEAGQITRDTLDDLNREYPLSRELDYVGDVRTHRGLDPDVDIFDLHNEYPNLNNCGAQYLARGADGKSGPCIEIHKESYSTQKLQDEFDERYALRLKYGDPMQPPKPGAAFYTVSDTFEGTIRHEYGHALSDDKGVFGGGQDNSFRKWQKEYWETHRAELPAISQYAASHPDEMFAEAFVQAQDTRHPDTLAYKLSREIMDAFERYMKGEPL